MTWAVPWIPQGRARRCPDRWFQVGYFTSLISPINYKFRQNNAFFSFTIIHLLMIYPWFSSKGIHKIYHKKADSYYFFHTCIFYFWFFVSSSFFIMFSIIFIFVDPLKSASQARLYMDMVLAYAIVQCTNYTLKKWIIRCHRTTIHRPTENLILLCDNLRTVHSFL